MKKLTIALAILSASISTAWAYNELQCPKVEVIKSVGVSEFGKSCDEKSYYVYKVDNFKEDSSWLFAIGFFNLDVFKTSDQALAEGRRVLPSLSGEPKLEAGVCHYNIEGGYQAVAIPVANQHSFSNFCFR